MEEEARKKPARLDIEADTATDSPDDARDKQKEAKAILLGTPGTEELKRRANLIQQSRKPEWFFSVAKRTERSIEWCSFKRPPDIFALLLFTANAAARDYIRQTRVPYQSVGLKVGDIQKNCANWAAAGFTGFALNRCPRCNFIQTIEIQTLSRPEGVQLVWALALAMQGWRAERLVKIYMKEMSKPRPQTHLEFLRDHVDCGNPLVHELIALRAWLENDYAALELSLQRLEEFPGFPSQALKMRAENHRPGVELQEHIARAERALFAYYGQLQAADQALPKS